MNMIYLLTGAAGFLGSNICQQLLERGDRVRAFVLQGDPAVKYIPAGVTIFEGDLCKEEDCSRFFDVDEDTETICIHCASMVTVNPDYSEKLMAVNVGGTENIIAAAKAHPECRKLVYVSSTGAIPELPKGQVIREVTQFVPYDDEKVVGLVQPLKGHRHTESTGCGCRRAECLRRASQRHSRTERSCHQ